VAVGSGAFSAGVTMTPQFMQAGTAYSQLLIDGSGTQWQAFDGSNNNRGALSAGSGVTLSYGGRTATVSIDPASGRVTIL
jgi:hypothetical protein